MALQVEASLQTQFGLAINNPVWRLGGLGIDTTQNVATAVLLAFVSVDAMNSNKQSVAQRQYQVTGQEFAQLVLSPVQGQNLSEVVGNAVYNHVRSVDPYFQNAKDV
jgi:hypothetical protein